MRLGFIRSIIFIDLIMSTFKRLSGDLLRLSMEKFCIFRRRLLWFSMEVELEFSRRDDFGFKMESYCGFQEGRLLGFSSNILVIFRVRPL